MAEVTGGAAPRRLLFPVTASTPVPPLRRQLRSPTGVRFCPSSAWTPGASFGQAPALRHRESVRPLLLRLAAAAAVLLATSSCVSLPADGPLHGPGRAPGGRTVAPAQPSPLLLPTRGASHERVVDVASARRKAKRHSKIHKGEGGDAAARHTAAGNRRPRGMGRTLSRPAHAAPPRSRREPVRAAPRHLRHAARAQAPAPAPRELPRAPRPRPTMDAGVVCRMASGHVRSDLLRLCRRTYGR